MSKQKKILSILFTLVFLFSIFFLANTDITEAEEARDYLPGQILLKFKEGVPLSEKSKLLKNAGITEKGRLNSIGVIVLKVPERAEEKVVAALSQNPNVEFVELDYIAYAHFSPNDPYFSEKQWGLENTGQVINGVTGLVDADVDSAIAWDLTFGGVRVAVLDTGIDNDHEDLAGKVVLRRNFSDSLSEDDLYGHGTHVAGIIAAKTNNDVGVAGGCPECELINGKVLNDKGAGAYSWISGGIIWAADNGAKVINLSLGGSSPSKTLEKAVNYAWNKGVVVVAAAGNSGNQSKSYPGAYTNAIAVASTNNRDQKSSFSSYGVKWVDLAAPGEQIFSTFPNHPYSINKTLGYDFGSGTSMATPMVSATAGLVWATSYGTSAPSVRKRLEESAEKINGTGTYWSAGRLNAGRAVSP